MTYQSVLPFFLVQLLACGVPDSSSSPSNTDDTGSAPSTKLDIPYTLEFYLPVGEFEECNRFETSGCQIYRSTWDGENGTWLEDELVVEAAGSFSPSLSPNKQVLSMDRVKGSNLMVAVTDLSTGTDVEIREGNKSNWVSDSRVRFSMRDEAPTGQDRWGDIGQVEIGAGLTWNGLTKTIVGSESDVGGADSTNCSGDDPYQHPTTEGLMAFHNSPYWANLDMNGDHLCPWMEGVPNFDHKNPIPVVVDVNADSWVEGESFWRFNLEGDTAFPGCAHLAFSPDGQRVLCTDQPTFYYEPHSTPSGDSYDIGFNRIYGFERNDLLAVPRYESVSGAEPLFRHLSPTEIADIDAIWKQDDRRCETYYTKRAEFCGDSEHIVANVYCATHDQPQEALFARLMWIDFTDSEHPDYLDLTSRLEDSFGAERGTFGGFSATCATVE